MRSDDEEDEPAADDQATNGLRSAFEGRGFQSAFDGISIAPILSDSFTKSIQSLVSVPPILNMWSPASSFLKMNDLIAPSISPLIAVTGAMSVLNTSLSTQIAQMAKWADQFRRILETAGVRLPTNWVDVEDRFDPELLNRIVRDEGLPLCWVAPTEVVRRLIDADTAQARRDIIGRSSPSILRECDSQLSRLTSPLGRRYARFARASIRSVSDDHRESGQALATNTLDSLIQRYGLKPPARNNPPDLGNFDLTDALVLGALWATYFSYTPSSVRETVPREFRRHASAHGVSARQYTLRNATIAIMHLVAVLRWLELHGFERQTKRIWS